jgi:hypothetical protein
MKQLFVIKQALKKAWKFISGKDNDDRFDHPFAVL